MKERIYDLEERLIVYAVGIVRVLEELPSSLANNHLGGQLLRSGSSPALNYAAAVAAESKKRFYTQS